MTYALIAAVGLFIGYKVGMFLGVDTGKCIAYYEMNEVRRKNFQDLISTGKGRQN